MLKTKRKTSKVLRAFLIISGILFLLFAASVVVFAIFVSKVGDPDLADFNAVFRYYAQNAEALAQFNLNGGDNLLAIVFSSLFYCLAFLSFVYLIVGMFVGSSMKRPVVLFGIFLAILALGVYVIGVTGYQKYWDIIKWVYPYSEHKELLIPTYALVATGGLYFIFSYVSYFLSIVEAIKNPRVFEDQIEEPKEEAAPAEEPASVEEEQDAPILDEPKEDEFVEDECGNLTKQDIADLIREIVREELKRSPNQGPLVVQYFGTVPAPQTVQQEPVKEEPQPEPQPEPEPEPEPEVVEEPAPEPEPEPVQEEPEPQPEPEIVPEPVVVVVPEVVEEPKEKKPIIRIPFQERMLSADDEMKNNYNELKNEILSYGVNSRVSSSGDAFRLHRKTYVKITIAGLSLKLYFALNPEDYKDSPIPVQDAGHKGIYAEIPLVFKVKSGLSMRRAKELIQTVMEQDGLEQGEIADTNWVDKLNEKPSDDEGDDEPNEEAPVEAAPKEEAPAPEVPPEEPKE